MVGAGVGGGGGGDGRKGGHLFFKGDTHRKKGNYSIKSLNYGGIYKTILDINLN